MRRRRDPRGRWIAALRLLVALTLAFIWGNSLLSMQASDQVSTGFLAYIRPLLELFVGTGNVTDHLVRKLAHFTEYAALGGELAALAALDEHLSWQGLANCLSAGLAVAVTDESIQLLSQRGSALTDVLLDFSGAVTGVAVAWAIAAAIRHHKHTA